MEPLNLTCSQELQIINDDVLNPSKEFKKHVVKIINAIASFAVVYLILFACVIIIAGGMIAAGILLLTNIFQFLVLIFGIGLILSGVMLIFFLIKFIFAKNAQQVPRNEITEDLQPELFNFIRELTIECGAPFPKHIYIIPEANASVFFDSSFWSMFFPVKKNLNIGLALVNSLNVSEFKAVLMHEFGHFSQRSMRFGSYVYNLNKVLYDMLYKNESYNKMLNIWGRWHMVLRFSAMLNIKIVEGMQSILKKLHVNINKKHLGLSREMEFHADTIAAYYAGSNNMISALRRLELGNNSYNTVLNFLGGQFEKGYRSNNVYPEQLIASCLFSKNHNLIIDETGLPIVNKSISSLNKSRVIIDNEWASHPTDNDREYSLTQLNIIKPTINKSAWSLFTNVEDLQEYITKSLYNATDDKQILTIEDFKTSFIEEINASAYDKAYKGFYDSRLTNVFDIDEAVNEAYVSSISFNELLNDENRDIPLVITAIQKDIALLDTISNNDNNLFEFEGIKYNSYDAFKIKQQLLEQLEDVRQKLMTLDKNIFLFFYHLANDDVLKQQLVDGYKSVFTYQKNAETDYELYNNIMFAMRPIYSKMKPNAIQSTLNKVYDKEDTVKSRIKNILKDKEIKECITDKQKKDIEKYLSDNWIYYDTPLYNNSAIDIFNNGLNSYISLVSENIYLTKKSLFSYQLSLIN